MLKDHSKSIKEKLRFKLLFSEYFWISIKKYQRLFQIRKKTLTGSSAWKCTQFQTHRISVSGDTEANTAPCSHCASSGTGTEWCNQMGTVGKLTLFERLYNFWTNDLILILKTPTRSYLCLEFLFCSELVLTCCS